VDAPKPSESQALRSARRKSVKWQPMMADCGRVTLPSAIGVKAAFPGFSHFDFVPTMVGPPKADHP
jgi:hypothetical protein